MTLRKVFLEPLWNLHAFQRQMLAYPPAGYEFMSIGKPRQKVFGTAAHWEPARALLRASDAVIPIALAKAWLERWDTRPPGTLLTYAVDHLVFRPEPWVVEVEYAGALVGIHPSTSGGSAALQRGRWPPHTAAGFCAGRKRAGGA